MAFCGKCGAQNPERNKFCAACGAELIEVKVPIQDRNTDMEQVQPVAQTVSKPQTYEQSIVQNITLEKEKPKRSFLWTLVAMIAIVMGIASWFVEGIPLTITMVIASFILAVLSIVKRARLRAISILAVIITGGLLILWIIQGIIDLTGGDGASTQKVESGEIEYEIPIYYKSSETDSQDTLMYTFENGNQGGLLYFICEDMYDDDGETAAAIAANKALIQANQTQIDTAVDRMLFEGIEAAINNIDGRDKEFIKETAIAGFPGKDFRFKVTVEGYEMDGRVVSCFDINTGNLYAVLMCETTDSSKNRLADFDQIIESAKIKGVASGSATQNKSTSGIDSDNSNGATDSVINTNTGLVDPQFKATMDSYEAFFDEYIAFMKKYSSSGDSLDALSMLSDYTEYLNKYTDVMEKINEIDPNSLSPADYAYYMEVTTRIYSKTSDMLY